MKLIDMCHDEGDPKEDRAPVPLFLCTFVPCTDKGHSAGAAYHLRQKQRQEELPLIKCLILCLLNHNPLTFHIQIQGIFL